MNETIKVIPNVQFQIIITNYSKSSYVISKKQVVAHLVPQKSGLIPKNIIYMPREILCNTEEDEVIEYHNQNSIP